MKIIDIKFLYPYFLLIVSGLIFPYGAFGQNENELIHPHYFDQYVDYQILPDGTCRVFLESDEHPWHSSKHALYADIEPGISPDSIEFVDLAQHGHYFNFLLSNLFTLQLKDGATILANTQFDCDYDPPGGLMMLDKHGEVKWVRDFYLEDIFEYAGPMVFTDSNAIFVGQYFDLEDGFIIDRNGLILDVPIPSDPYNQTIETSYGFVATKDDQLDILDTSFQVLTSYTLDQEIQTLEPLGSEHFMIRTDAKFYELDSSITLRYLPLSVEQFSIVWKSPEHFWAVSNTKNSIIKQDTFFAPVDTIFIPKGVDVKMGFSGLDPYVIGEYISQKDRNIIVFKGLGEELQMELPYDIGITSVTIPDTVWVYSETFWGVYTYVYEFVNVEVTNFGSDTVFYYNIEALDVSDCSFCSGYNKRWEMDVPLAPGESSTLSLGQYSPNCVQDAHSPLCITTTLPNNKADGNYENDKFCQPINTIILDTDDPVPFVHAQFFPNPANQQLNIALLLNTNFNQLKGNVFDLTGHIIESFEIAGEVTTLSTLNWSQGIYLIKLSDSKGNFITRKLIIQH